MAQDLQESDGALHPEILQSFLNPMAGVATRCLQQRPCRVPSLVPHCEPAPEGVEAVGDVVQPGAPAGGRDVEARAVVADLEHELAVQVATGRLCRRRYQFAFQAPQALRERMQLLRKSAGSIFIFAFWWLADESIKGVPPGA